MSRLSFNTRLQMMWCCVVGIAGSAGFFLGAAVYADEPGLALPAAVFLCLGVWVLAATLWVRESEIRKDAAERPTEAGQ